VLPDGVLPDGALLSEELLDAALPDEVLREDAHSKEVQQRCDDRHTIVVDDRMESNSAGAAWHLGAAWGLAAAIASCC
jgi:hypothetical protein